MIRGLTEHDNHSLYIMSEDTRDLVFAAAPQPVFLRGDTKITAIRTASVSDSEDGVLHFYPEAATQVIDSAWGAEPTVAVFSVWDEIFKQTFSTQETFSTAAAVNMFWSMTYDEQQIFMALHQTRSAGVDSCAVITSSQSTLRDLLIVFDYPHIVFDQGSTSSFRN
ncbi:MAG: hypothetical protein V4474_03385 [Patescibacteria group bacterium]